ncbi:MAG: phosphate/phosphite/phosphonate ABC transporter substrate-binding protein [Leptolyngbyaceae cyanobacterium SL_5_14]|nr:phosphate/phosphite/phosphonate ABC transporter substrate-binding protein [Leptolyngbyaceae cyanobacterium SL_5_14]NJO67306.1 phosphate/phosphite/phosphonate ABC transporter substrate-binding protein [Leptolyngbyaceae cyanobacterium RM1_405_57]
MFRRRLLLVGLLLLTLTLGLWLNSCTRNSTDPLGKLVVGIVSYDTGNAVDKYERFREYLAGQTRAIVELEPAFNELAAVEQIQRQVWSIVFASPGLAAIAISSQQYIPIFTMQGINNLRSVIVVRDESQLQTLGDLANQTIALGEPGSAAGYYLPLYDLYGLTLAEVRLAPTPKTVLEWLDEGAIVAGALSEDDFQTLRNQFRDTQFRVLHTSRPIPPGAVLLAPTVERNQQEQIEIAMEQAPSNIIGDSGYIPNVPLPDYSQLIELVEKIQPIESRIREKPAVLTVEGG